VTKNARRREEGRKIGRKKEKTLPEAGINRGRVV
jgi:hypothetical protein